MPATARAGRGHPRRGLVENTGPLTVTELLPTIQQAIRAWVTEHPGFEVRPIVVSIDDDPPPLEAQAGFSSSDHLPDRLGVITPAQRSDQARQRLERCEISGAYRRISPPPRIGAQAATGWEISETARTGDLVDALKSGPARRAVDAVRRLLDLGAGRPCP